MAKEINPFDDRDKREMSWVTGVIEGCSPEFLTIEQIHERVDHLTRAKVAEIITALRHLDKLEITRGIGCMKYRMKGAK